ncbi:nuclear transport factor 2 family protein [Pelagibacterium lacus]|uniref:SnoaL-like domain-containing protein n=1 Tax=Pelagibacterium lacus TaxID=2282655 RepID=A0A369W780_9HYPH|nr:nuclear transport factor 2 family protein [Pelagibacterium lacus]RDE10554.1 hypothetical protein DVH29_00980 [Pelagibacterium lacus]
MTSVTLSGACGNSPKNAFAEQVAIALVTADAEQLADWLIPDCVAIVSGDEEIHGREAALGALSDMLGRPDAVTIHHAITHGRTGAVNGTLTTGKTRIGFCFVLAFRTTKADSIAAFRLYRS